MTSTNGPSTGSRKSKDGYVCSDQDRGNVCQGRHKFRRLYKLDCWNIGNIPKEMRYVITLPFCFANSSHSPPPSSARAGFTHGSKCCSFVNLQQKDNLLRDSSKYQRKTHRKREAITLSDKYVLCVLNTGILKIHIA